MDFITGLPPTAAGHDTILVFIDKLTRMVHLAPTKETCTAEDTATLLITTIFRWITKVNHLRQGSQVYVQVLDGTSSSIRHPALHFHGLSSTDRRRHRTS